MEGVAGTEVQAGSEVPDENGGPAADDVAAPGPAAEEVDEAPTAKEMPAAEEVDEAPTPEDVDEAPTAEEVEVAGARPTHRIVRVVSVDVVLPDQFPTVTLEDIEDTEDREDAEEPRRLAFRIGTAEGVALAHALAGTTAPRPLTHDLFADSLERYGVEVLAVRLTGRIGPTYLAELELVGPAGREVLSCRPSDGICLALRQRVRAPVLCDERLFTVVGDVLPDGG